ncbi:MAG: hypothetical protein BAA02_11925 [Paenibacillaceae bacterium ZCTH02-B3]|nr:MAG: hypothetical protein BAA02_11925 [Paenibacillaceae bacterium ZCTH02-B3]
MDNRYEHQLPDLSLGPENRLWIFGTNEIARQYYEQICRRYGEHVVNGFINTAGRPATFLGKKVYGLAEKREIGEHEIFLVATRSAADIAVASFRYYYGVPENRIIYRAEWLSSLPPNGKPVLIHQFGKVGSTSILHGLRRLNLEAYQTHVLNAEKLDEWVRDVQKAGMADLHVVFLNMLSISKWFLSRKWNIISAVRDPLSRNISWFFESLYSYVPDYRQQLETDPSRLTDLCLELFIEKFPHEEIFHWFDTEIKDHFGIDVLAHPFDKYNGYVVCEENGHRLLVLQFERLPNLSDIIREFLGLSEFELIRENISEKKDYGFVYREFLKRIRFDEAFLDRMYDNKFTRHFYSDEEIETFRRKWSKQS